MMGSRSRAFLALCWVLFGILLFPCTGRECFPASDELTGYPCETDVVTFNHPTKRGTVCKFHGKVDFGQDPNSQSHPPHFFASWFLPDGAAADENCSSFFQVDLADGFVSFADNPRALHLSRSPRRYTPFRDTALARSTRPSRRAVSRHLTVSSPPAPSAFAAPARGSCPPTRAPRGRRRWPVARP